MAERLSVEQDVVGSRPTSLPWYPFLTQFTSNFGLCKQKLEEKDGTITQIQYLVVKKNWSGLTVCEAIFIFMMSKKSMNCTKNSSVIYLNECY